MHWLYITTLRLWLVWSDYRDEIKVKMLHQHKDIFFSGRLLVVLQPEEKFHCVLQQSILVTNWKPNAMGEKIDDIHFRYILLFSLVNYH